VALQLQDDKKNQRGGGGWTRAYQQIGLKEVGVEVEADGCKDACIRPENEKRRGGMSPKAKALYDNSEKREQSTEETLRRIMDTTEAGSGRQASVSRKGLQAS